MNWLCMGIVFALRVAVCHTFSTSRAPSLLRSTLHGGLIAHVRSRVRMAVLVLCGSIHDCRALLGVRWYHVLLPACHEYGCRTDDSTNLLNTKHAPHAEPPIASPSLVQAA